MQHFDISELKKASLFSKGMTLSTGREAMTMLAQEEFQASWELLYKTCTWATVFQSRQFVTTWYKVYQEEYLPIVLVESDGVKLTGLLTMAVHKSELESKGGKIIGAGKYEAEYQAWLSEVHHSEAFIKAALLLLMKQFPEHDIWLRYLPAGVSLDWLQKEPNWQKISVVQSFRRALMDLSHPELPKMFRKSEYRNKLNRLKRLEGHSFEQILEPGQFAAILPTLSEQYDFRQGAMFNKSQFRDNPLKADLLRALFEQGLLHVTVLKARDEILASIVAVAGKGWAHLGAINTHSPFYANYSPGFVHFITLGQQLAMEGFAVFDLTAGGDAYKERIANQHDLVHTLLITHKPLFRLKRQLRKLITGILVDKGFRPMSAELAVRKKMYLLKNTLKVLVKQGLRANWQKPATHLFQLSQIPSSLSYSFPLLQHNSLNDLLLFEPKGSRLSRWEFLEEAMRRFELGEQSYTWSDSNGLMACVWLSFSGSRSLHDKVPEGAALLQPVYCHPLGQKQLGDFLAAVAAKVSTQISNSAVYASAGDVVQSKAWQQAGFQRLFN